MTRFKKHDFEFFSSKEELQDTLARKKASILFEMVNKDIPIDEFIRENLKLFLLEAVELGINPTLLVKDRLELLTSSMDAFFDFTRGEKIEGRTTEEIIEMWKEETNDLKGMTEEEIYNALSEKQD